MKAELRGGGCGAGRGGGRVEGHLDFFLGKHVLLILQTWLIRLDLRNYPWSLTNL